MSGDYTLTPEDQARFAEEVNLGMLPPQHKMLQSVARTVAPAHIQSRHIQEIIARLVKIAASQQRSHLTGKKRRTLVGLAAPQIGEPLRIIVVDTHIKPDRKKPGRLECFINPEIIWRTRETAEDREGCFSTGPVWGLVRRPVAVKVRALTPDGVRTERIFEDFTGRIMQHEIDHLNGIRFPERIVSDRKRHWVHTEELSDYPGQIRRWPHTISREQWDAYKQAG